MQMLTVRQELKTFLHTRFSDANYVRALSHNQILVDNRVILDFDPDTGRVSYIETQERVGAKKVRHKEYDETRKQNKLNDNTTRKRASKRNRTDNRKDFGEYSGWCD